MATVQGYGVDGSENISVVRNAGSNGSGNVFQICHCSNIVLNYFVLVWLSEQITQGIGNGISLIIFTGIVAQLPLALSTAFELEEPVLCQRFHCFPTYYVSFRNRVYGVY